MAGNIYLVELSAMVDQAALRSVPTTASTGAWFYSLHPIAYDNTKTYVITGSARRNSTANGALYIGVTFFDAAGVAISDAWVAASGVTPGTSWATYSGTVSSIPGGTAYLAPTVVLNHPGGSVGYHECQSLRIALSTATTVALNDDEFFRKGADAWTQAQAAPGLFVSLPDGTPYATTLRYATAGYQTLPTDTPAKTFYDARVIQPCLLRQELPANYSGAAASSYGELILANGDGKLSPLAYMGLDGQTMRVLEGPPGGTYAAFVPRMVVAMEQAIFDDKQVRIRLKDTTSRLARPLIGNFYAGNNSLPNGLEGNSDDIKGQPKPMLVGSVKNLAPPCVNTTRLIYQVNDGNIDMSIGPVYDRGLALTHGVDYTSQSDMETNAPSAGQYRNYPPLGMFRIGSAPAGLVTCDAVNYTFGSDYKTIGRAIALQMGFVSGEITQHASALTTPDNWPGTNPVVGVWVNDSRTAAELLNQIFDSVGAWYGTVFDDEVQGKFIYEVFPLAFSERSYAPYINSDTIISVRPITSPAEGAGIPAWRVDLGYAPILTVQEFDINSGVSQSQRSFISNERRCLAKSNSAVKTKYSTAITVTKDTQIENQAAADDEATRLLELNRFKKLWFEVVVRKEFQDGNNLIGLLTLGGYVRLSFPALQFQNFDGTVTNFGYFNVMAIERNFQSGTLRLTLRQATEPSI